VLEFELLASRQFDFNANNNITATGYIPVLTSNLYSANNGFGWQAAIGSYDRGAPDALLRDGHFGVNNTFSVQVDPAEVYTLTFYFRDNLTNHDLINVFVEGSPVITNLNVITGVTSTVVVPGMQALDGIMDIQFIDAGGTNPNFIISGLDVVTPLLVAGGPAPSGPAPVLTQEDLDRTVQAAISRFQAAGASQTQLAVLQAVQFQVTNLGGPGYLGLANPNLIRIDDDAAGYGWFVDSTPFEDSEFSLASGAQLVAVGGPAAGRIDLLTAVMHELGHVLGFTDLDGLLYPDDLMTGTLATGVRRVALDRLFADEFGGN
jgi:hypothetical protein